jgi:hypothetical protein
MNVPRVFTALDGAPAPCWFLFILNRRTFFVPMYVSGASTFSKAMTGSLPSSGG